MPYSNIVFIKLFINLLDEDDRFLYRLNESQQLLYIKMLMLAGKSHNKIISNIQYIRNTINYGHDDDCFKADMLRIMEVYPKLKQDEKSYFFENFESLHNFIGTPKDYQRKSKGNDQNKNKNKNKNKKRKEKDVLLQNGDASQSFIENNKERLSGLVSGCLAGKDLK
jgi:hypothetical protein